MTKALKVGALLIFSLFILSCGHSNLRTDSLWHIVGKQCLEKGIYKKQKINPCHTVNTEKGVRKGHAILKDRIGILQYLLLPTTKMSGIESRKLQSSKYPNYFYLAWKARSYMELELRGDDLNPEDASLAINSKYARTQEHFHIHISCPKPSIHKLVKSQLSDLTNEWTELSKKINNHTYFAKKISLQKLKDSNVFASMASSLSGAKKHMDEYGLGLLAFKSKKTKGIDLVLLATRKADGNKAAAEEIQDHTCPQIYSI